MRGSARTSGLFCLATLAFASGCGANADAPAENGGAMSSGGAGPSAGSSGMTSGGGGAMSGSGGSGPAGSGGIAGKAGSAGTGSGGSAGSGGSVAHVVGKCDGLGEVGQWEEITPPGVTLDPPYKGTIVVLGDPQTSGTLYTTTSASGVFKSTDCGGTWSKVDTGRNADQLDSGLIWSAVIDPVEPETLYALTGYGPAGLWKTTNGGVDWDQTIPADSGMPGFVGRVAMDPTDHLHILISFHDNCMNGHTPVCFGESTDGGATWNVLDFPTELKNGWGEGTALIPIDATHWLYEYWELYSTSDAGAHWTQASGGGAAVQGGYFQTPDGTFYLGSGFGVLTSPDGSAASWSHIDNSAYALDAIIGDGDRLFAGQGFQPPSADFIWTASYDTPTQWSALATPGAPDQLAGGVTSFAYDSDHQLLYTAAQAAGLWRMVTK